MKTTSSTLENISGEGLNIDIILPRFNDSLGLQLLEHTEKNLLELNIAQENIAVTRVPGTLEIPFIAKKLLTLPEPPDAVIALGIVIRGETTHYDYVSHTTIDAIMQLNLAFDTPIITGILTVENEQQALDRIDPKKLNKGQEFAQSAIEMALLNR